MDELQPSHVHLLIDGCIVEHGDMALAENIAANGYEQWKP
jgi:Fe-S cluster assembly ATPase SufC